MRNAVKAIGIAVIVVLMLGACEDEEQAQDREGEARQSSYEVLTANQPAQTMSFSPSRETVNFWIETWDEPGKLSYVYLLASNGQMIGYYIFEGLPVSYCAMLTPNYDIHHNRHGNLLLPAPGVDGVYYSGGQCSAYYGKDATTGSYLEYTVGQGISALIYEEPLPRQDIEPLGFAVIGDEGD